MNDFLITVSMGQLLDRSYLRLLGQWISICAVILSLISPAR